MPVLGMLGIGFGIGFIVVLTLDIRRILREDREWQQERRLIDQRMDHADWELSEGPILVLDKRKRDAAVWN